MPSKRSAAAYSAGGPALAHVVDDGAHGIQGGLDVELGARQRRAQLAQASGAGRAGRAARWHRCAGGLCRWSRGTCAESRFRAGRPPEPSTPAQARRPSVRRAAVSGGCWGHGTTARRREGLQPGRAPRGGTPVRAGVGGAPAPRPQERQGVRGPDRGDPDGHDLPHRPGVGARRRLGAQRAGGRRVHDPLAGRRLRLHGAEFVDQEVAVAAGARVLVRLGPATTSSVRGRLHPARTARPRADRGAVSRLPDLGQAS